MYSLFLKFLDLERLSLASSSSIKDNFFQSYKISSMKVSGIERIEREGIRPCVQGTEVRGTLLLWRLNRGEGLSF